MAEELAINGGRPVRTKPWPQWPYFAEDEIQAVADVLKSGKVNYWTGEIFTLENGCKARGQNGLFEHEFGGYIGTEYAIALANGSLALELALYALNIGNGDEVIVTNRTFIASASACVLRGAVPVFADIEEKSQNISLRTIKAAFTDKTRAIICVHLAGHACEMDEIMAFAQEHNIKVIEDCAQCLGGKYKGEMLGSIGHAAAFSFCQDKIMTTGGEGGMLTTNDPQIYRTAWAYKDHGKDFDRYNLPLNHPLADETKAMASTYYTSVGTNWRMTEMQAAIGRKQLKKMPQWIAIRRRFAKMLDHGFARIDGICAVTAEEHIYHAYYKYYVFLDMERLANGWTRNKVIDAISAEGVVCQQGSTWGVGLEDAWEEVNCLISGKTRNLRLKKHLPNDYKVGSSVLMFQVHPTLDDEAIKDTVAAVTKVMAVVLK
jgi:dTDP-4-amino-4,6-dideoxygalactose transaminase